MIILLMGAPGSGKGTQADLLKTGKRFIKLSTGDLLRREISEGTVLGKRVEAIVNSGGYVSDEILMEMVSNALETNKGESLVLDGFPRTLIQAEWLNHATHIDAVIHIEVSREELIERMSGRRICTLCETVYHTKTKPSKVEGKCDKCGGLLKAREDASVERIVHRLEVYESQTLPVLEFFKKLNLYFRIDGDKEERNVSEQINVLLTKLNLKAGNRANG